MKLIKLFLLGVVYRFAVIPYPLRALAQQNPPDALHGAKPAAALRDGQHDFDFEFGSWKTHLKRLLHPLTGSTARCGAHCVGRLAGGLSPNPELKPRFPTPFAQDKARAAFDLSRE
jgi:hypothetical protein